MSVEVVERKKPKPGNRFGSFYPWEEWFGKPSFTLIHGVDYDCTPSGMIANIRAAAARFGVRVSIRQQGSWDLGRMIVTVNKGSR